jgi:hypothetical protein
MEKFNGYEDYFNFLKNNILSSYDTYDDKRFIAKWMNELKRKCKEAHYQYVIGEREDYELTDDEIDITYQKAGYLYSSELLDEMCEDGSVQVSINTEGELLYQAK